MNEVISYQQDSLEDLAIRIDGVSSSLRNIHFLLASTDLSEKAGGAYRIGGHIKLSGLTVFSAGGDTVSESVISLRNAIESCLVYTDSLKSALKQIDAEFAAAERKLCLAEEKTIPDDGDSKGRTR